MSPGTAQNRRFTRARASRFRFSRTAVVLLCIAVGVALIRAFVVQSFVIPTGSMEPTLGIGDRVLVTRYSYRFSQPSRGDVIVFDGSGLFEPAGPRSASPLAGAGRAFASAFGMPVGAKDYVKRVIGLPGDRVVCCTASGQITVNGTALDEPYVYPGDAPSGIPFDIVVPAGRLWVMGDHRSDSADSRAHRGDPGGGTVPIDRVVGRVGAVFWPAAHFGGLAPASYGVIAPSSLEGTG